MSLKWIRKFLNLHNDNDWNEWYQIYLKFELRQDPFDDDDFMKLHIFSTYNEVINEISIYFTDEEYGNFCKSIKLILDIPTGIHILEGNCLVQQIIVY